MSETGCAWSFPLVRIALAGALMLVCWNGTAEPVLAQVPRIQGQGTAASGMGNAFSAQADDPSALHYNAAGMTQLHGVEFMTGVLLSGGTTSFTSPTGATATGDRNGSVAWPPPGHLYVTANLKDLGVTALGDLTAGIGVTVPFGSLTRWPNDGPFRTATTFNSLPLLDIKPTLAYKLTEDFSIGLGADIYTFSGLFGEGHVERKSVWPGGGGIPAGSQVELFGADTAAGFNASVLYTAIRNADGKPVANIGVVYRSQATLHLNGAFLANGAKVSDATATFVLPQVITGAVALWPVRNHEREWKLEVDVDYVGWKSVRNLDVHLANGTHHSSTAELAEHLWSDAGNRIQVADTGVAVVLGSGPSSRIHESANTNARFRLRPWESFGRCEHCRRRRGAGLQRAGQVPWGHSLRGLGHRCRENQADRLGSVVPGRPI